MAGANEGGLHGLGMEWLRVATLNLWNKRGPWQRRMELVAAEVNGWDPDIVALQEVLCLIDHQGRRNQAAEVAGGRHWVYGEGHDLRGSWVPSGQRLAFGNAVVSRHPIASHTTHPLPGADVSDQRRSLLHAVVEAPPGPVDVFVTHLNWRLDEGEVRVAQVKAAARIIEEVAPDDGRYPPLLMGDLNAEPTSEELRFLRGEISLDAIRCVGFADAWQHGGEGSGYTFDGRVNPFAAEHDRPPRRIDYILIRGPAGDGRGRPLAVRRAFDRPSEGIFPSDHFGVVADLSV